MPIVFERGAFENPDKPWHFDDVDTSIVVVTSEDIWPKVRDALEKCRDRWWGIDGAGRHHDEENEDFWDNQPDEEGDEWHTAKYISEVTMTDIGPAVYVDSQSYMPEPMRMEYRRVLVEELRANGVEDAIIRSRHADDYESLA